MFSAFLSKRHERFSPLAKRLDNEQHPQWPISRVAPSHMHPEDTRHGLSSSTHEASSVVVPQTQRLSWSSSHKGKKATPSSSHVSVKAVQVADDVVLIQEYVEALGTVKCSACQTLQLIKAADVTRLSESWLKQQASLTSSLQCRKVSCAALVCGGCGKAGSFTNHKAFIISGAERRVSWCCTAGLMFGIWVLACGMSPNALSSSKDSIEITRRRSHRLRMHANSSKGEVLPAGTGYASGLGICSFIKWILTPKNRAPKVSARQLEKRPMTPESSVSSEWYLKCLATMLTAKGFAADSSNSLLRAMLVRSPWMPFAMAILSGDSLDTACKHHRTYDAVLELLIAFLRHPITTPLVTTRQTFPLDIPHQLLAVSFDETDSEEKAMRASSKHSFLERLSSTASQAELIMIKARQHPHDFKRGEGAIMYRLATRVNHLHEKALLLSKKSDLLRSTPRKGLAESSASTMTMAQWHKEACLESIDDDFFKLPSQYAFSREAVETLFKSPPHGRMKRLIIEISSLKTSLPQGIFVRYAASRLDMMKVLIIGPSDTPYEHGFFEFDVMCGMNYPGEPPNVAFRTTNGGQTRMNPNLYSDGTVCLSLLGTWPGETWKPAQSTLLQILVSLQAMVLCDRPWYNEPGRSSIVNARESLVYNANIRHDTLMYAVLPWVELIKNKKPLASAEDAALTWNLRDNLKPVVTDSRRRFYNDDEERDQMIGCSNRVVAEAMACLTSNPTTASQLQAAHAASKNCILPFMKVPYANVPDMSRICWLETAQVFFNQHAKDVCVSPFFDPKGISVSRPGALVQLGSGVSNTPLRNAESLVKSLLVRKGYLEPADT